MATELYNTINIIHNGYYHKKKLHDSLELLTFRPDQYILIEREVILSTCGIGGKFLRKIINNNFSGSDQYSLRTN